MLIFQNGAGDQVPALVTDVKETQKLCEITQLDFTILNTPDNEQAYNMLGPRTIITVPATGQQFMLSVNNGAALGTLKQRTLTALHVGHNLHDKYVDTKIMGSQSLAACLAFITKGTPFRYVMHDTFKNYAFSEGFGQGFADDLLINTLAKNFGFEFYFDNYTLHIEKSIGKTDAFLFVDNVNCSKIKDNADYSSFATHIKGQGKLDDKQVPLVIAEYTSSLAAQFGVIDAQLVSDERFTDKVSLLEYIKSQLQDYPLISYTVDFANFKKGAPLAEVNDVTLGNSGTLVDRFDIDVQTRISGLVLYHDSDKLPVITFGNTRFDFNRWNAEIKRDQRQSVNFRESMRNSVQSATEKAHQAYTSRLSGTPTTPTPLTARTPKPTAATVPGITLMTPDGNTDMGLPAGAYFYAATSVENVAGLSAYVSGMLPDVPTYDLATQTTDGLMSASDKAKLDKLKIEPLTEIKIQDSATGSICLITIENGEIKIKKEG